MEVNLPILSSSLQFHTMPFKITLVQFHQGTIGTVFLYSDNWQASCLLVFPSVFKARYIRTLVSKGFSTHSFQIPHVPGLKIAPLRNVALSFIHVFSIMQEEQSYFLLSKFMSEMNIEQFGFSALLRLMCKLY